MLRKIHKKSNFHSISMNNKIFLLKMLKLTSVNLYPALPTGFSILYDFVTTVFFYLFAHNKERFSCYSSYESIMELTTSIWPCRISLIYSYIICSLHSLKYTCTSIYPNETRMQPLQAISTDNIVECQSVLCNLSS